MVSMQARWGSYFSQWSEWCMSNINKWTTSIQNRSVSECFSSAHWLPCRGISASWSTFLDGTRIIVAPDKSGLPPVLRSVFSTLVNPLCVVSEEGRG